MTKSKENDNGRYFEFLLTEKLIEKFNVQLTSRAKKDQERDARKEIEEKTHKEMSNAADRISYWIGKHFSSIEKSTLDRHPDKEKDKKTHEDISLTDSQKNCFSFSLKHNHEAIFHGRITSCSNWLGINKESKIFQKYDFRKKKIISDLHEIIPPGKEFAYRGIKPEYQSCWSNFIEEIHENAKECLLYANTKSLYLENLFNTIIGKGIGQYRILKIKKKIIVQNLINLKSPSLLKIENIQKITKDERSKYVWYLVLKFNNGITIEGRNKQDSTKMAKTPKIKTDWQVVDWGNSGMKEQEI